MFLMRWLRAAPLFLHLLVLVLITSGLTAAAGVLLMQWLPTWQAALLAFFLVGTVMAFAVWRVMAPLHALFRALSGAVDAYRDGDFSFGVRWDRYRDLRGLVDAHMRLGNILRQQRTDLVQRELLLDTLVQNTPVAMLLLDQARRVVLGNLAARRQFANGRKLEGHSLDDVLANVQAPVREAVLHGGDGVVSVAGEDREDIFHLARHRFRLNGRDHELVLLREMTTELRRQEVQTWKKAIRVVSHELNNSLAPIASLAHSGSEMVRRGQLEKLPIALATIEERARHLERFLGDYARFAKLPNPRLESVVVGEFVAKLASQMVFSIDGVIPDGEAWFDPAQIEQVLLNLLKNAVESGTAPGTVVLTVKRGPDYWRFEVADRGAGMNDAALASALLPFYSTKRTGTGLGLALAREIAEAHGGHLGVSNRDGGGVSVWLSLPVRTPVP